MEGCRSSSQDYNGRDGKKLANKTVTGTAYHDYKGQIDGLVKDTTFTDRQRAAVQSAAQDLFNGLDGLSLGGKTVTVKADVFTSAASPSMSVSVAFT